MNNKKCKMFSNEEGACEAARRAVTFHMRCIVFKKECTLMNPGTCCGA